MFVYFQLRERKRIIFTPVCETSYALNAVKENASMAE